MCVAPRTEERRHATSHHFTGTFAGPFRGRAGARGAGRKSPLRVVSELPPFRFDEEPCPAAGAAQPEMERPRELTAAQLRRLMISEFRDWLGTRTNRKQVDDLEQHPAS